MKRLLISGIATLLSFSVILGQTLAPCGTAPLRSEWLKNFQKDGIDLAQRPVDFRIAVDAHLLGNDNGGVFDYGLMLGSMAALESDYDSTGIGFVLNLPVESLHSTIYNSHDDVLIGADLMFANNNPAALNIYFLSNPAGNCGYNLPYAGIAIADQCAGSTQKTLSHEVGHALSLPHPFLGWEGGQGVDGIVPADFTQPAPRTVTYDYTYFQDTLIRDTTIIDTTQVELVARTNCYEAADGFCDTPADYIAGRWTCDQNGLSPTRQIDPTGATFQSDGSLIMGYSDDDCQARFSDEQKAAMSAFAMAERPSWVRTTFDTNRVRGFCELQLDSNRLTFDANTLMFTPRVNATHYFVQVSERRTFSSIMIETVVTEPQASLTTTMFEPNKTYYARIYAFNDHSFTAGMSQRMEFSVPEDISNTRAVVSKIKVYPNPVLAGASIDIPYRKGITRASLYDSRGALVSQQESRSETQLEVPAHLTSGVYNLMLLGQDGNQYTARIQVIR